MADVEEPRWPAGSSSSPMSAQRPPIPVGSRVLFIWSVFGALNLVGELVWHDIREQPWWLRFLASLLTLLIAIPAGEGIARGFSRLLGRDSRVEPGAAPDRWGT